MKTLYIIKIGGKLVTDKKKLASLLDDFSSIKAPKILVHGGGNLITEVSAQLGNATEMVSGRRVTDFKTMNVVNMVSGRLNKYIVAQLQKRLCNAVGLSGADGKSILSKKRKATEIDYGFVGDIVSVETGFITTLLNKGYTPVFCPITMSEDGVLLNTNADTIASKLAITLSKTHTVHLKYCMDKPGVLSNIENNDSIISILSFDTYETLVNTQAISQGMLPKLHQSFSALLNGVKSVSIGNFTLLKPSTKHTKLSL